MGIITQNGKAVLINGNALSYQDTGDLSLETLPVTENGIYNAPTGKAYNSVTVNVAPPVTNPIAEENDVIFIDYDGTIRYSYTAAEFAQLTELPVNPTHEGLTSQGWNWTLSDAKSYVSTYGRHCIGQNYKSSDGITKVYVEVDNNTKYPYIGLGVNGTVTIDWGDNSTEILTGTSLSTVVWTNQHNYSNIGSYIIKITPSSGSSFSFLGSSANMYGGSYFFRYSTSELYYNEMYHSCVKKLILGSSSNIGNYGVAFCRHLSIVILPDNSTMQSANLGTYAFHSCYALSCLVLPDGKTSIPNYSIYNTLVLKYISFPKSITSVGQYALNYCDVLEFLAMPPDITSYTTYGFSHLYSLKSLVGKLPYRSGTSGSTLPSYFYEYCYLLNDLSQMIPSGVTNTGSYTFQYCYSITSLSFPSSLTTIGTYCFGYCRSLTSITIPNTVTSLGNYSFQYCSQATSLSIGTGVTSIGSYCFQYCTSLTSATIPSNVTTFNTSGYQFRGCTALTSITFNNSITTVPTYCFDGCTALTSIKFPTGCTTIGTYCFRSCTSLTSITIPSTVTSIGNYAFYGCTFMQELHFTSTTPPTIGGSYTFTNLPASCKIYVPTGTLSTYTGTSNMPSSSMYTYIEE